MTPSELMSAVRAALDKLERIALAATPGPWNAQGLPYEGSDDPSIVAADGRWVAGLAYDGLSTSVEHEVDADAQHIALHDPAAVLRRVAALREIVERHAAFDFRYDPDATALSDYSWTPRCDHCYKDWPCPDLLSMARGLGIDPEENANDV